MRLFKALVLVAALLPLGACVTPGAAPNAATFAVAPLKQAFHQDDIAEDQVVLVGKIELSPTLKSYEQDIPEAYKVQYQQRVYGFFSANADANTIPWRVDSKHGSSVNAKLGEFFFPVVDQGEQHYHFARVYVDRRSNQPEHFHLPGDAKLNLSDKMRYVYIGTLRYHRDAFGVITKVTTVDEYSKALRATRARFGKRVKLHKQLLKIYLN